MQPLFPTRPQKYNATLPAWVLIRPLELPFTQYIMLFIQNLLRLSISADRRRDSVTTLSANLHHHVCTFNVWGPK